MRYSYRLDGLGCAHCASVIEREVQGWQDVKSANLDLMTNKLVIESDTEAQVMTERVKECVYRVESKVKVVPLEGAVAPKPVATPAPVHNGACDCGHDHHDHAHTHDGAAVVATTIMTISKTTQQLRVVRQRRLSAVNSMCWMVFPALIVLL